MKTLKKGDRVRLPKTKHNPEDFGTVMKNVNPKDGDDAEVLVKLDSDQEEYYIHITEMEPFKEKKKSNQSKNKVSTKTKKQMKKSAKKSAKKESKKAAKKSANRPAAKRAKADGELTRKEAKGILKISVYAIDQALANKELKGLSKDQVLAYKKKLKE